MDENLKEIVLEEVFLYRKICKYKNNLELGEMFPKEFEYYMKELEKVDRQRCELIKKIGGNEDRSFLNDITFEDNGKVVEGQLFAPMEGAIRFVDNFINSTNLFMQQVAIYVAACM